MSPRKAAMSSHPMFFPAIWLMQRLRYPQKIMLIGLLFIAPLGLALYTIITNTNQELHTIKNEIAGLEYIKALVPIFEAVPQHRGMRNALLKGDASFRQALSEKRAEINRLVNNMDVVDARLNKQLKIGNKWQQIKQDWAGIKSAATQPTPEKSWVLHTELIDRLIALILHAEAISEILGTTYGETHYITTGVLEHLPQEIELIGQARGLGAGIAASSAITPHDRFILSNLASRIRLLFSEARHALQAFGEKTASQQNLKVMIQEHATRLDYFLTLLKKEIFLPERISIPPADYFTAGTRAIFTSLNILHSATDTAKTLLTAQAASLSTEKTLLQFTSVFIMAIAAYLLIAFYFYVMCTVTSLDVAARRMLAGNMASPVEIESHDELGQVVHSFNEIAAALTESSSNLKAVVDYAVDGIISINESGIILSFNPAAGRIFGYDADEVIGSNIRKLMPDSYHAAHDAGMKRYIETGETTVIGGSVEVEGQRKDGSVFPLDLALNDMRVGSARLFLGTVRDITSRKKMEEEKQHLATAVEQATEAIIITSHEGYIQFINPAFERLAGYSLQDVLGKTPRIMKSGEQDTAFYQDMWKTISSGQVWKSEIINKRKDETLYEASISITPIRNKDQDITHYLCMQHDISHEKKMKAQMEHTQRLESLGVLAGGIAHDFNNLLTPILGNAFLAGTKLDKSSPAMKYLEQIEISSEKAAALCKQMLAYSGKGQFEMKAIDLSGMVREMAQLLEVSISKHAQLKYRLAETALPAVKVDVAQMQQVIMNLIINASDSIGDKNGEISIATGIVNADAAYLRSAIIDEQLPEGRYVYLEVSDTGCGMDKQTQARIFDPFFTTKTTGTGLGMSAVLGIIKAHGGVLKLYSEVGQGTMFRVLLPSSDHTSLEVTDEEPAEKNWMGSGTVLIVDDEEDIRNMVADMLAGMGFDILIAENGQQGVDMFRQHQREIAAVLLDMTMPEMNGEQAFGQIRQIDPDAKVIVCSGYSESDAMHRLTSQGLAGFLHKPYGIEKLKNKLRDVLEEI